MAITLTKPVVGGSQDSWGDTLNTALDDIAAALNGTAGTIAPDMTSFDINGTAVTASAAELNLLDGVTATTTEINYVDGVTSNIQTQLDAKQAADATLTALAGLATGSNKIPYSTGTDTFGQLDFKDEDSMSSNSASAVPSQQSVKAYTDGLAIGVGQSWQDVKSSRSLSTSYQNTTGRPIMVAITHEGSQYPIQVSSNGSTWVSVGLTGNSGVVRSGTAFVVPNSHYYRVNGGSGAPYIWSELR